MENGETLLISPFLRNIESSCGGLSRRVTPSKSKGHGGYPSGMQLLLLAQINGRPVLVAGMMGILASSCLFAGVRRHLWMV